MGRFRRDTVTSAGLAWLIVGALALGAGMAAPGCTSKTPEQARKELEELKKKQKPKQAFERLQVITEPNEVTFVPKKTEEEEAEEARRLAEALEGDEDIIPRGHVKPGHWTGVLVTTTANLFDFTGEMTSTPRDAAQQPIDLPGSGFRLDTSRPVALPKGQRKTLETIFFAPPSEGRKTSWMVNQLSSRQQGVEPGRGEVFQHMPSYQYHLFVLARDASRYKYLRVLDSVRPPVDIPPVIADDQDYYRVETPRPQAPLALPTRALAWSSVAYVVWDDVLPTVLVAEQQQAMLDWLHWGGSLIVSGPRTLDAMRGTFLEPYLPAAAAETADIDAASLAELNAHWSIPDHTGQPQALVLTQPWSGIKLAKHTAAEFVAGTGELVVERRVGRGRIVATAFRLTERELLTWPSYDSFVNGCLLGRVPRRFDVERRAFDFVDSARKPVLDSFDSRWVTGVRYFSRDVDRLAHQPARPDLRDDDSAGAPQSKDAFADWNLTQQLERAKSETGVGGWDDFNSVASVARETLRAAAGISIPNRQFVVWMIGIYLLIVVPVNWALFRLLGRVELAWIAVPVLAIAWGIVVVWLAQLDIGFARAETEVAVLEAQSGYPRGHLTRYSALYTSLSTTYDVHFDDLSAVALPFALDRETRIPEGRSTVALRSVDDVELRDFVVSSNSTGMVHSEQMVGLDGTFDWQHPPDGSPSVANNTRLTLSGACVIRRGPEAEAAPSGNPHKPQPPPYEAAWLGDLAPGSKVTVEFKPGREAARAMAAGRERSPITSKSRPDGTLSLRRLTEVAENVRQMEPGDVRLIGWYDQGIRGVHTAPSAPQARRATLVVVNLRYQERAAAPDENLRVITDPFQQ